MQNESNDPDDTIIQIKTNKIHWNPEKSEKHVIIRVLKMSNVMKLL